MISELILNESKKTEGLWQVLEVLLRIRSPVENDDLLWRNVFIASGVQYHLQV